MNKMKLFLALACLSAGAAQAATCNTAAQKKLQFFGDDTGIITWQTPRVDSPKDANSSRLAVSVLRQDGNDYAGAIGHCTGIEGKLAGQVKNLSFDFLNDSSEPAVHIGAGAPRYSVELDSTGGNVADTYAYLSAYYCQSVLPEDTRWSRADWTGRTQAGCEIFVGSETFTSDGVNSAWKLLALAHPGWAVVQAYLVMDEEGTAFVDRLAFQNEMFTTATVIQNCSTEQMC